MEGGGGGVLDTDYTHATPTSCPYHTHLILAKLNERLILKINYYYYKIDQLRGFLGACPPGIFCILNLFDTVWRHFRLSNSKNNITHY